MECLGKMGTDHDDKEDGTDQLQAGECSLFPCKRDSGSAEGQKDHSGDDNKLLFMPPMQVWRNLIVRR
jgi:hypothetical protein